MDTFKEDNSIHYHHVGSEVSTFFQDTTLRLKNPGQPHNQETPIFQVDSPGAPHGLKPKADTNKTATYSTTGAYSILEKSKQREIKRYQERNIKKTVEKKSVNDSLRNPDYLRKNLPYFNRDIANAYHYDHLFVNDSAFITSSAPGKPVFLEKPDSGTISHASHPRDVEPVNFGRSDWILGIILLVLVFFTWARIFYEKYFTQKIQAVYNTQILGRLRKDRNSFLQRVTFVLVLSYVIVVGLFIYQVFTIYKISFFGLKGFPLFITFCLIVLGIYILKYVFTFLVGYVFDKRQQFGEYLQAFVIINENIGMFLLPVVAIIPFVEGNARVFLIYIGLAIAMFFYIIRYYRAVKTIASRDVFIFYVFLYFCTFEILPVLLFYKTVKSYIL
jgi:hypothetical protein